MNAPLHIKRFTEDMLDNDLIVQELGVSPGQTIVDAGCGNGYMSMVFAHQVGSNGHVYAFDMNKHFISALQEECIMDNLSPLVGDIAHHIPISNGCANIVYMSTVVHSQSQKQLHGIIREVRRVVSPGGLLAVVEIKKHETPFGPPLKQRYSPEELHESFPFTPLNTVSVADHFYMQTFRVSDM